MFVSVLFVDIMCINFFYFISEMRDLQTDISKLDKKTEEHESAIRKIRELEEENEGYGKKINGNSFKSFKYLYQ